MAKLEIPLNMNPSLTAALEKVSAYAGRLEVERKDLVDKLNHAESVIHDLTGDKELLKSELERSRDMANYFHGQLYSMNEYCLKNGFEFIQNNPALTMIHEMEKLRSERDALAAQNHELKGLIMRLRDRWWPFVHGSVVPSSTAYNLGKESADVLCKSPQQHLADIRAEAIESVITEELYKRLKPLCGKNGVSEAEDYLTEQAAKVRQGGTWLKDSNVNGGKRQGGE